MQRILFIVLSLYSLSSFAQADSDNPLVYLEQDLIQQYGINLTFENNCNDSIILFSSFKNHYSENANRLGYHLTFFRNRRPMSPNWTDMSADATAEFSNGKTILPPHTIVSFPIALPYLGSLGESDAEISVQMALIYRYVNVNNKKVNSSKLTTNKLSLNDANRSSIKPYSEPESAPPDMLNSAIRTKPNPHAKEQTDSNPKPPTVRMLPPTTHSPIDLEERAKKIEQETNRINRRNLISPRRSED